MRWFSIDPLEGFLPQSWGFLLVALILTAPRFTPECGRKDTRWRWGTVKALVAGVMWGSGVVLMQYSQLLVGVAVGFTFSQLGVIISTFGGIVILGEHRTKKEMVAVVAGVVLLVVGGVLLGVAKAIDVP